MTNIFINVKNDLFGCFRIEDDTRWCQWNRFDRRRRDRNWNDNETSLKEEEGIESLTTVLPFAMHAFFNFEYLTYHFFYDFYLVCGDRSIRVSFLEQQKKLTIHWLYQFLVIWWCVSNINLNLLVLIVKIHDLFYQTVLLCDVCSATIFVTCRTCNIYKKLDL